MSKEGTTSTISKEQFTHFLQCLLDDSYPGLEASWVREQLLEALKVVEEEIAWDEANEEVENLNTDEGK